MSNATATPTYTPADVATVADTIAAAVIADNPNGLDDVRDTYVRPMARSSATVNAFRNEITVAVGEKLIPAYTDGSLAIGDGMTRTPEFVAIVFPDRMPAVGRPSVSAPSMTPAEKAANRYAIALRVLGMAQSHAESLGADLSNVDAAEKDDPAVVRTFGVVNGDTLTEYGSLGAGGARRAPKASWVEHIRECVASNGAPMTLGELCAAESDYTAPGRDPKGPINQRWHTIGHGMDDGTVAAVWLVDGVMVDPGTADAVMGFALVD